MTHRISSNHHILDQTLNTEFMECCYNLQTFFFFFFFFLFFVFVAYYTSRSGTKSIEGPMWNRSRGSPWANRKRTRVSRSHMMMTRGNINGWVGNSDTLARRAHGQCCGWGHLHVELRRKFQCSELLNFLLQPPVFLR